MAKDNTASNIIMQGKGQYKPLDDSMLQWNAKMQNIRNFEEAKRKNQEQRDLRDKLAEIEALGLPAHLQKKLREDSEEALRQVREEGLDPNSIDFRVKLNRIAGKGKQYEDFVTEGKAAMTQEGMVIEEDEYGTINRRPEYNKKFLSLWDENTEIEDVDALIGEVKEGYSRIAPTLEFTPKEYSELADEFFARNSDAYTTMQELKQQGIEGQNLITETLKVHPDLAEGFNSYMDDATRWVAGQNYARDREIYGVDALGTGADYHKRMSSAYHIRPEQQTKQTTEVDPYKLQAQKDARDGTGSIETLMGEPAVSVINKGEGEEAVPTLSTTMNIDKPMPLDVGKSQLYGQPRRLFFDPKEQKYYLEYIPFKNLAGKQASTGDVQFDALLAAMNSKDPKYKPDYDDVQRIPLHESDPNFDALVSTIAKTTKSQRADVVARINSLKEYDLESVEGDTPSGYAARKKDAQQETAAVETITVEGTPNPKEWLKDKQYQVRDNVYYYDNESKAWKKKTKS